MPRYSVRTLPSPTGHKYSEFNLMINTNKSHPMYHECLMYLSHTSNSPTSQMTDATDSVEASPVEAITADENTQHARV